MDQSFDFQIPGLTEAEADVAHAFVTRMHEIALEEGQKLDLLRDGGPVLTRFVMEMLPNYSVDAKAEFMIKVLNAISGTLKLYEQETEGRA